MSLFANNLGKVTENELSPNLLEKINNSSTSGVGDLTKLKTGVKDNVVGAVNEVTNKIDVLNGQIGDIPTLSNTMKTAKGVKYIAHRGLSAIAPENTIPAYELAGKSGFWGGETDVISTSDGVWVVMHDDTVDRMTNGTGNVSSMTYAQIKALKIDAGNNTAYYPNLRVPTMEEYLMACKKYNLIPVIEIKSAASVSHYDTFVNLIKKFGYEESCIVISFGLDALQEVRKRSAKIVIQYLADISTSSIQEVKQLGNAGIDVNYPSLTKEKVELAHSNGILVNCWTVDDHQIAKTLIGYGVDFITTNFIAEVL